VKLTSPRKVHWEVLRKSSRTNLPVRPDRSNRANRIWSPAEESNPVNDNGVENSDPSPLTEINTSSGAVIVPPACVVLCR